MRKHNLRAFACALLAVIFAVSIAGCKADKTTELENRISELENENTLLRSQIDALTAQLGSDDQLDLVLEVTLTTDAVITTIGGSWFLTDGQLSLVVG